MVTRVVRSHPEKHAVLAALAVVAILALPAPALAGPPLLCHPFDIGRAPSLLWDGSRAFWQGKAGYQLANLVGDTHALSTPTTSVIVRMETLRRAALYASADGEVAARLLFRLSERLRSSERTGNPEPLALFDFACLVETYRQIADLDRGLSEFRGRSAALRKAVADTDGYALATKV